MRHEQPQEVKLTHNGGVRVLDIIQVMDNPVGRLKSELSPLQVEVIIGSVLGDARLECRSTGVRYPTSARVRVHQSDVQKEYVLWKYKVLENLCSKEPRRVMTWHDPIRNKNHYSWYFHTKTFPILSELYQWFYHDKVKVFPEDIEHILTPRMLAVWFMDDGSKTSHRSFTINTHCFSTEEQLRIVEVLKKCFDISSTIVKDRTKFKISIGSYEYEKFVYLIEPFIIPTMAYKIANPRNDLAHSRWSYPTKVEG
ncbi:MAG TPA: LAGLIDADG endonuclease [Candidatus Paceibacterota bacterium]